MFLKLNRVFRYYIAGGINTIFSYLIFIFLIYFGLTYWLAVIICYLVGLVFNYKTIKLIAFNDSSKQSLKNYFIIYILLCFINIFSLKYLIFYGINAYLAAWIIVLPLSFLGYLLNKKFVFYIR